MPRGENSTNGLGCAGSTYFKTSRPVTWPWDCASYEYPITEAF